MKKKKLNAKLTLNKRNVSELNESLKDTVKGGGPTDSCVPYCQTYYSCKCTQPTYYWACSNGC
ncbi:class I lanthipeptide [Ascidiimonas sp. W6]|uniref:class I lanthipeptide n=1 Tax=Ascidiimonas meishanensis TaxID=3128903 RepID=UPI0030EC88EE